MDVPAPAIVGASLAASAAVPLVAAPARARRVVSAALTGLGLALPWLLPADAVFLRALVTLLALVAAFRWVDLAGDPRPWSAAVRLAMVFAFVDARAARRVAPGWHGPSLAAAAGWGVVLGAGTWLGAFALASPATPGALAARWLAGLAAFYAAAETVLAVVRVGYRRVGLEPPPTHRAPAASTSVGAFWAERWNLTVSAWLARHVFRPLARRRRPRAGLFLGFVASAAAHAWFALVPLGPAMAASMGGFFLLHGGVVLAERRLGVRRWSAAAGHVWTWAVFLGTAPLFVEPTLRILGDRRDGPPWSLLLGG